MLSGALVGPASAGRTSRGPVAQQAPTPAPNAEVRGMQFLFEPESARLMSDVGGKVLWLSTAADELLQASASLTVKDGRLIGTTRHSELLLRKLFADAESMNNVDQLIGRAANELPEIFVQLRSCCRRGLSARVVALTIRRLHRAVADIPDLIRLYGLTPTEQQITRMMVQGRSVTEIAEELHKSVLTVRTHIKRMYVKLNVSTKEQLFSTVIRLMVD